MLCVTYTKLDMWQVQITLAMLRCIWTEALLNPIERAVPQHIKDRADTRELIPYPDYNTRSLCIGRSRDPQVINNVVTLSQVLHIAQDDLFNHYSKM